MLAAISPSNLNYEETLSTLQYAARAKEIVNQVSINATSKELMIQKLRHEIDNLLLEVEKIKSLKSGQPPENTELQTQIQQRQKLLATLSQSWDDRLKETQKFKELRQQSQIDLSSSHLLMPFLIDISPEIGIERELVHPIRHGVNTGLTFHASLSCIFLYLPGQCVWLIPFKNSEVCVNDQLMVERQMMKHGDRITTDDGVILKFKIGLINKCLIPTSSSE